MKNHVAIFKILSLFVLLLLAAGLFIACDDTNPEPTSPPENVLAISPLKLPEAAAGQPYEVTITVTGNRTPVASIIIEEGTLPTDLAIQYQQIQNTASITGIPHQAGAYKFTVEAFCMGTNSPGQVARRQYELVIK